MERIVRVNIFRILYSDSVTQATGNHNLFLCEVQGILPIWTFMVCFFPFLYILYTPADFLNTIFYQVFNCATRCLINKCQRDWTFSNCFLWRKQTIALSNNIHSHLHKWTWVSLISTGIFWNIKPQSNRTELLTSGFRLESGLVFKDSLLWERGLLA